MPFKVDLRNAEQIERMVEAVVARFGRIDILINNASALWWQDIADTPTKKYDLINQVNARGTFFDDKIVLTSQKKNGFGRVLRCLRLLRPEVSREERRIVFPSLE